MLSEAQLAPRCRRSSCARCTGRGRARLATGICWASARRERRAAAVLGEAYMTPSGHASRLKASYDSIYLADDPITALTEVSALVALPGGPVPVRAPPLVIISADGVVSRVLDLTDAATRALLGTNQQEISGTWVKVARPPTQTLAQAAYNSGGIAGIRYPSANRQVRHENLIREPRQIGGSSVRLSGSLRSRRAPGATPRIEVETGATDLSRLLPPTGYIALRAPENSPRARPSWRGYAPGRHGYTGPSCGCPGAVAPPAPRASSCPGR